MCAGALAVLAGGATLGLVSVAGLAAGPLSQAGADSAGYQLHCVGSTGTGLTLPITGTKTTGTLPASVTPGKPFTLTNYGLSLTLPGTGVFGLAATKTILGGTYATTVTATGATPATATTTLTVPVTHLPPKATFPVHLTTNSSSVNFTAPSSAGPVSVSTGTTSHLVLTVTLARRRRSTSPAPTRPSRSPRPWWALPRPASPPCCPTPAPWPVATRSPWSAHS